MSAHVIYYQDRAKMMRPVHSRDEYLALRNSRRQVSLVSSVRKGKTPLKMMLLQMNYSCIPGEDGKLAGCKTPSMSVGMDIDHISPSDLEQVKDHILAKKEELGLLMLELSARGEGYHLVFKRKPELSQEDNLRWASDLLGVAYDEGAKDITRVFFTTTASPEDLIYLSDSLFEIEEVEGVKEGVKGEVKTASGLEVKEDDSQAKSKLLPLTSSILPPSLQSFAAFDETLKMTELDLKTLNREGVRHNTLKLLLPTLCQMMPKEELLAVLAQKMPEYSKEKDCQDLVANFYDKYVDQNRPMNLKQKEIFLRSLKASEQTSAAEGSLGARPTITFNWDCLPIGLKESLKPYPENMWPALLVGQMPALMALADGVKFRYCNGRTGQLGSMAIIMGEQASNKSAVEESVERWLVELRREDEAVKTREDKVREANKRRKANERAQEAPAGVVRVVPITISCSKLLKRLKQSAGHCLYSISTEAETLLKSNGSGAWAQKWDIYRNSFDRERWGVDYNSDQSESGDVNVAYNWTILGTPRTVMKMFKGRNESNAENGLSSRCMLSEMPDSMFSKITVFKELSEADLNRISQATSLLRSASGFYDTPRLRKAINDWLEEKRIESSLDMDVVKDRFRRRAGVIGFRCGVVFMLLAGKESDDCLDFALKMADYTLEMQIRTFGPLLQKQYASDSDTSVGGSINGSIFDRLPSPFTLQDLRQLKGNEFSDSALYTIISRWKSEGWVEKAGKSWTKKK